MEAQDLLNTDPSNEVRDHGKAMTTKGYSLRKGSTDNQAVLTLRYGLTLHYWAPTQGGYVREVSYKKSGYLGQQVSQNLDQTGDMLWWSPEMGALAGVIQKVLRKVRAKERLETRDLAYWRSL